MVICRNCECPNPGVEKCRRCEKEWPTLSRYVARQAALPEPEEPVVQTEELDEPVPSPRFKTLAEFERDVITTVLEFYAPTEASTVLGIGKSTLYARMKLYGLATPQSQCRVSRNRKESTTVTQ